MGASKQTGPKLLRVKVSGECYFADQRGYYTVWEDAQAVVDRLHKELLETRKQLSWNKNRVTKLQRNVSKEKY